MELPNLIELQLDSYKWLISEGIEELFDEINPVQDFTGNLLELKFGKFYFDEPKYSEKTAKLKNHSYEASLKVEIELKNKETGKTKKQEVFMGDYPVMTDRGTFIINGNERVVASQLIRSGGVFFSSEQTAERKLYGVKIIPNNRGPWLEIETSLSNVISVKIDRKRKLPITTLLRAFGYVSNEEILKLFKDVNTNKDRDFINATLEKDPSSTRDEAYVEIYKKIRPGDLATVENAKGLIDGMFFDYKKYDFGNVGRYKINKRLGINIPINRETRVIRKEDVAEAIKELIVLNNTQGEADDIDHLANRRLKRVGELLQNRFRIGLLRTERIIRDRMSTNDPTTVTANQLINVRPIVASVNEFFASSQLSNFMDQTNPLAELTNKRRLSAMGPGGLSRERAGMEVRDVHRTHYGRICPIETPEGPNIGLVTTLATFASVNEYGFIETPYIKVLHEAKNDGKATVGKMISEDVKDGKGKVVAKAGDKVSESLAKSLAKLDQKMIPLKARVTSEIVYLDAFDEEKATIAEFGTPYDENGYFTKDLVVARKRGEAEEVHSSRVDYMDVASHQTTSISTALIPFLEHDAANRALMGANMQRQAVSLLKPESPIVGTGVEWKVAEDSGQLIKAKANGKVKMSSADMVRVKYANGKEEEYALEKFVKSNQGTCINQKTVVNTGDSVKKGDVLVDGTAMQNGEIALGKNVLTAYMLWGGANFEDAIIISEKLAKDDVYSSIHLGEFDVDIRDTKLGPEVITRDIPNVGDEALRDLDEDGIVRIGAEVSGGDILVGKITPKGETELSAEERLLRAIFGEKARDVKDSSLRLSVGVHGKVVDIRIMDRDKGDELPAGITKKIYVTVAQTRKISVGDKMAGRHGNKGVISKILPVEDMPHLEDGTPIEIILNPLGVGARMNIGQVLETHLGWAAEKLGYKVATPIFDGVKIEEIKAELKKAGLPEDGKITLYDGKTGDAFSERVVVGYNYMLKLLHLVEDKIHARSIGPYAMVTQQPLGGKSQRGGQRFGEMEVWALEAYGAAHTLQEVLTIKSDDVIGRSKAYENIIKGEQIKEPRIPESFNVLVKEMEALGLSVELIEEEGGVVEEVDATEVIQEKYDKDIQDLDSRPLVTDPQAEGLGQVDVSKSKEIDDFEVLEENDKTNQPATKGKNPSTGFDKLTTGKLRNKPPDKLEVNPSTKLGIKEEK
ncbi:DNA-directed RNA polymerase subunit beta [bacterium (Candidatus Howlettbacteria) CG_4_10_14_0_8_um_filter_40_9]|nr:MAG: DNA-directed RNA polymerase subunit beta [bacterium (Candidatus Howlettbacteria) CG_4_10_14_0_8_um_filter_40_9]